MKLRHVSQLIIGMGVLFHSIAWGLEPGSFSSMPLPAGAQAEMTRLAVIDASARSVEWLRTNRAYLEQQQIPVMVLGADLRSMQPLWQEFSVLTASGAAADELAALEQAGKDSRAPLPVAGRPWPQGGLVLGPEPPEPPGLIAAYLESLGVAYYPVVLDRGIAWQVNPFAGTGAEGAVEPPAMPAAAPLQGREGLEPASPAAEGVQ